MFSTEISSLLLLFVFQEAQLSSLSRKDGQEFEAQLGDGNAPENAGSYSLQHHSLETSFVEKLLKVSFCPPEGVWNVVRRVRLLMHMFVAITSRSACFHSTQVEFIVQLDNTYIVDRNARGTMLYNKHGSIFMLRWEILEAGPGAASRMAGFLCEIGWVYNACDVRCFLVMKVMVCYSCTALQSSLLIASDQWAGCRFWS